MQITTWNVNGVRAIVQKNFRTDINVLDPDIICLQETKAQIDQALEALVDFQDYNIYANHAIKKGYSGVATLSKQQPISITRGIGTEEHDQEGRVLTMEFSDFYLVNVYVPNSGSGLKNLDYRQKWDVAFHNYSIDLDKQKPVILTGDMNVAHQAIDLARPESNYNKTPGYSQEEIDGMSALLGSGFIDIYRNLYPEKEEYSFWSYRGGAREKNIGWRLDYFIVSERLKPRVKDCIIHTERLGSDHCPLSLYLGD